MKVERKTEDGTIHNLTVGYIWDKGGYDKHYAIKDNDRKILFIRGGLVCEGLEEHKMLDFMRKCFGLGRTSWNGGRLRFTKFCHEDDLGKLETKGWQIVCDWDEKFDEIIKK